MVSIEWLMYDISNIPDVIRHYGGMREMQQRFGVTRTCISNWKSRGIPPGWHGELILDFAQVGKTFDPSLFDLADHPGSDVLNELIASRE